MGTPLAGVAVGTVPVSEPARSSGFVQWVPVGFDERPAFFPFGRGDASGRDRGGRARGPPRLVRLRRRSARGPSLGGAGSRARPGRAALSRRHRTGLCRALHRGRVAPSRPGAALLLRRPRRRVRRAACPWAGAGPRRARGPGSLSWADCRSSARRAAIPRSFAWRALVPAGLALIALAFFAARVVPPLDDQDLEVQATAERAGTAGNADDGDGPGHPLLLRPSARCSTSGSRAASRSRAGSAAWPMPRSWPAAPGARAASGAAARRVSAAVLRPLAEPAGALLHGAAALADAAGQRVDRGPGRGLGRRAGDGARGLRRGRHRSRPGHGHLPRVPRPRGLRRLLRGGHLLDPGDDRHARSRLRPGWPAAAAAALAALSSRRACSYPRPGSSPPHAAPAGAGSLPGFGAALGLLAFAAWGMAIDAPTFVYDFLKVHVAAPPGLGRRPFVHDAGHLVPLDLGAVGGVRGPLRHRVHARRGRRQRDGAPLPLPRVRVCGAAVLLGALVFSLTDWRQTKHLSLLAAPALLALAAACPRIPGPASSSSRCWRRWSHSTWRRPGRCWAISRRSGRARSGDARARRCGDPLPAAVAAAIVASAAPRPRPVLRPRRRPGTRRSSRTSPLSRAAG